MILGLISSFTFELNNVSKNKNFFIAMYKHEIATASGICILVFVCIDMWRAFQTFFITPFKTRKNLNLFFFSPSLLCNKINPDALWQFSTGGDMMGDFFIMLCGDSQFHYRFLMASYQKLIYDKYSVMSLFSPFEIFFSFYIKGVVGFL